MLSSITVSHDLIPTTDYSTRAPEGTADVPWGIIAAVVGVAVLATIIIAAIAIVRFLIGRNRFQSKDQTIFAFRRSHEGRQQSHWYWPTYKHVISNV